MIAGRRYTQRAMNASPPSAPREAARLGDITPQQRRAGLAAWLGWMFDGLEMHLYTLVATPFVKG